jgi:hypothetical protein
MFQLIIILLDNDFHKKEELCIISERSLEYYSQDSLLSQPFLPTQIYYKLLNVSILYLKM